MNNFKHIKNVYRVIELIKAIKEVLFKFERQKYLPLFLYNSKLKFYTIYQEKEVSNAYYLGKNQNIITVVEQYSGNLGVNKALVKEELKKLDFLHAQQQHNIKKQ